MPVASFITQFCTSASHITLSRKRDGKYLIIYDEVDACRVIHNAILYQGFRYNAEPEQASVRTDEANWTGLLHIWRQEVIPRLDMMR